MTDGVDLFFCLTLLNCTRKNIFFIHMVTRVFEDSVVRGPSGFSKDHQVVIFHDGQYCELTVTALTGRGTAD